MERGCRRGVGAGWVRRGVDKEGNMLVGRGRVKRKGGGEGGGEGRGGGEDAGRREGMVGQHRKGDKGGIGRGLRGCGGQEGDRGRGGGTCSEVERGRVGKVEGE